MESESAKDWVRLFLVTLVLLVLFIVASFAFGPSYHVYEMRKEGEAIKAKREALGECK